MMFETSLLETNKSPFVAGQPQFVRRLRRTRRPASRRKVFAANSRDGARGDIHKTPSSNRTVAHSTI